MRTLALLTLLLAALGCTSPHEGALDRQPLRSRPRASSAAPASSTFVTVHCESYLLEADEAEVWLGPSAEGLRLAPLERDVFKAFLERFRRRVQHPPPGPVLTVRLGERVELADLREEEGPKPLHRTGAGISLQISEERSGPWVVFSGSLWTREGLTRGNVEAAGEPAEIARLVYAEHPLRLELRDGESTLLAPPERYDGLQRVVLVSVMVHELR